MCDLISAGESRGFPFGLAGEHPAKWAVCQELNSKNIITATISTKQVMEICSLFAMSRLVYRRRNPPTAVRTGDEARGPAVSITITGRIDAAAHDITHSP